MVSRSDRRRTEVNREGRAEVLAEHGTDGRCEKDVAHERSGSWGTEAQGTQSRDGDAGHHVRPEPNTRQTMSCTEVFLKLGEIAEQAARDPSRVFTTLAHLLTPDFLAAAFYRLRQSAAPGCDEITVAEYAVSLEANLADLHERLRTKRYRAQPVRRVWVDKEDGKQRPLGLLVLEDKIVQRAVVMILESIYEKDFYDFSYGFRPGRSPHQALHDLREQCMNGRIGWIVDADVSGFFDSIDRKRLQEYLRRRVNDGSLRRLIGKWLHVGVLEGGAISYPDQGTPQGGVISPLLANVFLHYVLDEWFVQEVQPRLRGRSFLIRFADDFIIGCEREEDARQVMEQLQERFAAQGLTIHPTKSRLIDFRSPARVSTRGDSRRGVTVPPTSHGTEEPRKGNGTFDFLGFTHYWARSRRGFWVIKRCTARKRLRRTMRALWAWLRQARHDPVPEQHRLLCAKLRGHYQYYGIRCNVESLRKVLTFARRAWRYWLSRRSQKSTIAWEKFELFLRKYVLPAPQIVHSI